MRTIAWVGALCVSIAACMPSNGWAQDKVAAPAEATEARADEDATAEAAVIGGIVGGVLGAGAVCALYRSTDSSGSDGSLGEGYAKGMVLVVGLPIILGAAALGALLGSTTAYVATQDVAKARPPIPPARDPRVTPIAAISPDGGYLGARLTF